VSSFAAAVTATVIACFSPEQDCARLAIDALDAARHEILVNAYVLTMGSGIPGALIRAHARGLDVRLSPIAMRHAISRKASMRSPRPAFRYG
jgi:hypothetical protein